MYICNIYCYLYCISLYVCTCFNKLLHPFPNFLAKNKEMRAGYRCLHSAARLLIQLEMDLNEIFTKDWSWPNVVNTWSWSQSSERFFGMMLWHCETAGLGTIYCQGWWHFLTNVSLWTLNRNLNETMWQDQHWLLTDILNMTTRHHNTLIIMVKNHRPKCREIPD